MPFVNSSAMSRVESSNETRSIWFQDSERYDFPNVPEHDYNGLLAAGSKGQYYHDHIKDRY